MLCAFRSADDLACVGPRCTSRHERLADPSNRRLRKLAFALSSGALVAEAKQTEICVYLSAILLGGLALNATLGWWWADPVAALVMAPLIVKEGFSAVRGESPCCDDCTETVAFTAKR